MRKAYKFRIYPTKVQEQKLIWILARCRELYNAALQERRDAYHMAGKSINFYDQSRQLPDIKALREEYHEVYGQVLIDVLQRVQRAMDDFFRRIKAGKTPGYPRFQGRNRYNSFTYPQVSERYGMGPRFVEKGKVHFPKVGDIKVKFHRPIGGKIKTATIKCEGMEWYAIFSCEVEAEKLPACYEDIGIDLGVTHFAALSDGSFIDNPRYYRKAEKTLEKLQQSLSRKKKGSHRREKAKRLAARAHRKIRNQRRDFLQKHSRRLVNQYQVIVLENLQPASLSRRAKPKQDEMGQYLPNGAAAKSGLNKSIRDAGWAEFVAMCTYKAAWAGRTLLQVNPHYTSQICSGCGAVKKKELSERWHSCECGCSLDRDHNAAINILILGRRIQATYVA